MNADRIAKFLAVVAALGALVVVATPLVLRYALERLLLEAGAQRVEVAAVGFNPLRAELNLNGLHLEGKGGEGLSLKRLDLRLAWGPWWRRLEVERLRLEGLQLALEEGSDGWRVAGLPLPLGGDPDSGETDWELGVRRLELAGVEVSHRHGEERNLLRLGRLSLDDFTTWQREQPLRLRLQGNLNGAALQLAGRVWPFRPGFEGRLELAEMGLAPFTGRFANRLTGAVGFRGDLEVTAAGGDLRLRQQGRVRLPGLSLPLAEGELSGSGLDWQGEVKLSLRSGELELVASGELAAERLEGRLPGLERLEAQRLALKPFRLQGSGREGAYRFAQGGELKLERLALGFGGEQLDAAGVRWQGDLDAGSGEAAELRAEGNFSGGGMAYLGASGEWRMQELEGQGTLRWGGGKHEAQAQLALTGPLWRRDGEPLFQGESLQLEGVALTGGAVAVASLSGAGLELPAAGHKSAPLRVGRLDLAGLELAEGEGLVVERLLLNGLEGRLVRLKDGAWELPDLAAMATAGEKGSPAAEAPGPRIRLGKVEVAEGGRLHFDDRSVSPPFKADLDIHRLSLADLDSGEPERVARLDLAAGLDRYGSLEAEGGLTPFAQRPGVKLQGRIDSLSLPPFSAYTSRELGYDLASGQLDAELTVTVEGDRLQGDNRLVLHNIRISPTDPAQMEKLTRQLDMPLESALAMLQDKNDDVRLNLPVSGTLSDPRFDLGDAVNQAVGKALKTAAVSYLKFSLQPFGLLLTLAEVAGEAAGKIHLAPVEFTAGGSEASGEAEAYLAKVAGVLGERPQLRLRLCGRAVAADREAMLQGEKAKSKDAPKDAPAAEALADALSGLARGRAEWVKGRLVESGVEPKRLFICNPSLDGEGKARVDLEI